MSNDQPPEAEKADTPKGKGTTTITTARVFAVTAFVLIGTTGAYLFTAQQPTNEDTFTQTHRNLVLKAQPKPTLYFPNPLTHFASSDEATLGCPQSSSLQDSQSSSGPQWEVRGSDPGCTPEARLGYSVSLAARTGSQNPLLLVGAPEEKTNKNDVNTGPGYVRAAEVRKGSLVFIGSRIHGKNNGDTFGFSVSISDCGQYGIAGAPEANDREGYVYLLSDRCGGTSKTINGRDKGSYFGYSVAADENGETYAVGAPALNSNDVLGKVYVYDRNARNKGNFNSMRGDDQEDGFGMAVSISDDGRFIAVGAPLGGYVRVFKFKNNKWQNFGGKLMGQGKDTCFEGNNFIDDEVQEEDMRFGQSVAMSVSDSGEKFVAIGIPSHVGRDCAIVYEWRSKKWQKKGDVIKGDHYDFGASIDITPDGNWLTVGDPEYLEDGQQARGRACLFKYSGSRWIKQATDVVGAGAFDNAGFATAIRKDKCGDVVVAVGSPMAEPNGFQSGMATVLQLNK